MIINKLRKLREGLDGQTVANIIYNNDKMVADMVDDGIEKAEKTTIYTYMEKKDEPGQYIRTNLAQTGGTDGENIMSQAAVTNESNDILEKLEEAADKQLGVKGDYGTYEFEFVAPL